MSKRDLRRKIEELQQAKHVGRQEDEEKARRARVISELERVEEERRQRIDDGTDASEADRRVGAAMLEEYIQHRRLGGGGGR